MERNVIISPARERRRYTVPVIGLVLVIILFTNGHWFMPDVRREYKEVVYSNDKSRQHTSSSQSQTDLRQQQRQQQHEQVVTYSASSASLLLRPQKALRQYIAWHSNKSLTYDYERSGGVFGVNDRSFIVGYYSCPIEAGNRLNDFWNSLVVAIVTNRTLLWKYYDPETCYRAHPAFGTSPCRITNYETDCSQVLKRASWIPSYDEWATISSSSASSSSSRRKSNNKKKDDDGYVLPPHETLGSRHEDYRIDFNNNYEAIYEPRGQNYDRFQSRVIQTGRHWFKDVPLNSTTLKESFQQREEYVSNPVIAELYSLGTEYLYGMLFRETFQYQHPAFQQILSETSLGKRSSSSKSLSSSSTSSSTTTTTTRASSSSSSSSTTTTQNREEGKKSIAIHVRHSDTQYDGSEMQEAVDQCLYRVLSDMSSSSSSSSQHDQRRSNEMDDVDIDDDDDDVKEREDEDENGIGDFDHYDDDDFVPPPCLVYLMSDRPKAIEDLTLTIQTKYGCDVQTVNHNSTEVIARQKAFSMTMPKTKKTTTTTTASRKSHNDMKASRTVNVGADGSKTIRRDHGPFAGMPFFLDLALSSQARDGFIGRCERSSTKILHGMIVHDSIMEYALTASGQKQQQQTVMMMTGHGNEVVGPDNVRTNYLTTDDGSISTSFGNTTTRTTLISEEDIIQHLESQLHVCCLSSTPAYQQHMSDRKANQLANLEEKRKKKQLKEETERKETKKKRRIG